MFVTKDMAVSCAQATLVKESTECYCTICGTVLYRTPPKSHIFIEMKKGAKCDCSFGCCAFSEHGPQKHMPHMEHRRSSVEVTKFTNVIHPEFSE